MYAKIAELMHDQVCNRVRRKGVYLYTYIYEK